MKILGLKLTHDSAFAVIDEGRLAFSSELEKIDNNKRNTGFCIGFDELEKRLELEGYLLGEMDSIVVDGWWDGGLDLKGHGFFRLADYGAVLSEGALIKNKRFLDEKTHLAYNSNTHSAGHFWASYCSSPFASGGKDAYVMLWDGGIHLQIVHYEPSSGGIAGLESLLPLRGTLYSDFPYNFEPFCHGRSGLSVAGKAMAFIALGKPSRRLVEKMEKCYDEIVEEHHWDKCRGTQYEESCAKTITDLLNLRVSKMCKDDGENPEDSILAFHKFLEKKVLDAVKQYFDESGSKEGRRLCLGGGSALNIKWNSEIRRSGLFDEVWVPPFPNDSGSAIGAACSEMVRRYKIHGLEWGVYSGPSLIKRHGRSCKGWREQQCNEQLLSEIIAKKGVPVVILTGRAELGPRALGNRSILASPMKSEMKTVLNQIKCRESFRPVAPVCLEEDAATIFEPGHSDPYMLFDHKVRKNWEKRIPAVCHLDGTARLQTVNRDENPTLYSILSNFKRITGIPVLCNTSANFNGKGFFPDVESAKEWGMVDYVWSSGILHSKVGVD